MGPLPYRQIVVKAMRDASFRTALEQDPKGALAAEFGIEIPDDVEVTVLTDTLDLVHAVLPAEPGLHGEERGLVADMLRRLRAEPEFRDRALRDPKGVVEQWTNVRLPERPAVKAVLETQSDRYIHLPHPATASITSMPEAEAVYGGNGGGYGEAYSTGLATGATYDSCDVCSCLTEHDFSSSLPTCCDGPSQTETPGG